MSCCCLPPELWDRIIRAAVVVQSRDFFDWEPEVLKKSTIQDLKSFSLVSQVLLFPAQSLLFRDIGCMTLTADSWHQDELSCWRRLAAMFKCSPHLMGHIRHLSITAHYEILSLVSAINLSRLRIIRISSGENRAAGEATSGLIPDIISESVRHIHLSEFYSLSYTTLTRILEKPRALEGRAPII
ncbi:hypothetical protein B0H17DRAFT_1140127 [Mycena rosella]|uniref:Uncharacterized protein n=1 Tax=Mycena rosella TaxID=1033263 RepID=A0AAD7G7V2_MYCRO|nr:hypothetical protein B0H17DRAFT_1140127 [Mycena rosella]